MQQEKRQFFQAVSPGKLLAGLVIFNLVWKIALIPTNRAEYTDGILQITLFQLPNRLYPPLFTLFVTILKPLFGNPETAGRFISAVSASLIIIPIFIMARRLFSTEAAFFASLVYTVMPTPLRWSVHAMTDSLFILIFFLAALYLLRAIRGGEHEEKHLVAGTFLAVLSTLTRYQGVLLAPVILVTGILILRRNKVPGKAILAQGLWIFPAAWILKAGFGHPAQFSERAGAALSDTVINILNLFESFLAWSPYFVTWPVFFVFLCGMFYLDWKRKGRSRFAVLFLYLTVALLILQSAFSSFQSRYLLPLMPFIAVFAGRGLVVLSEKWISRKTCFSVLLAIVVIYGLGFSLTSLFLQREAFGDIKDAAQYVSEIPGDIPVYSNEAYKDLGPVKMRFWSKREILPYAAGISPASGSVICLSSAYGGAKAFAAHTKWLMRNFDAQRLALFESEITPLLPDIMQEPQTHQNPLALTFRYTPQKFRTEVYRIP